MTVRASALGGCRALGNPEGHTQNAPYPPRLCGPRPVGEEGWESQLLVKRLLQASSESRQGKESVPVSRKVEGPRVGSLYSVSGQLLVRPSCLTDNSVFILDPLNCSILFC